MDSCLCRNGKVIKQLSINLLPSEAYDDKLIQSKIKKELKLKVSPEEIKFKKLKLSLDARSKFPVYRMQVEVYLNEAPPEEKSISSKYIHVKNNKSVAIIGAGPAGYFAALELIENGIKPVIFDRGKDARTRRKDLRAIQQFNEVNPDSNYCFGEGGAGTYSDGKLYTRSDKRGDVNKVLKILVEHGSKEDILYEAHPHIGSNKLPYVVQNIRKTILKYGGEIHFDSRLTDITIKNKRVKSVIINKEKEFDADNIVLATGHSARDIFYLLHSKNILVEAKPFAIGVRIEHPQQLIDFIQYKQKPRDENLPASSYKLVSHAAGRGVFSFCMCPGGLIVPSATAPGEIVVNGMSMSRRDSEYANSGIVVQINLEDLTDKLCKEVKNLYSVHNKSDYFDKHFLQSLTSKNILCGLEFQKSLEQLFFLNNPDGTQQAPAQKITDFVNHKISTKLSGTSYIPGIYSSDFDKLFPEFIKDGLRKSLVDFGKKMKGYYTDEAQIIGIESRTSSPVKIPRDKFSYEHIEINGLYPCGEGAGYAGGIVSAAIDGQNVAKAIVKKLV
jgi:uncharacterized FAD-dependent dehydrogenase